MDKLTSEIKYFFVEMILINKQGADMLFFAKNNNTTQLGVTTGAQRVYINMT